MSVRFYQDGAFRLLAGAKAYHNGAWVTLPATAKVYLNNAWHYLGNVFSGITVQNSINVSSGWVYLDTTVNSSGRLYVSSGGTATGITVNSSGRLYVSSEGTATVIKENGGYVDIVNAAHFTFTQNAFSQLVLTNASATVHSGTTANSVTVNSGGDLRVFSGGTANWNTLISGGYLHISSGGSASNVTVRTFGRIDVASGGTALNVIWTPGVGRVNVFDGAYVTYASNYAGIYIGNCSELLSHVPSISETTIDSSLMYVMSRGTATSVTFKGTIFGSMYVSNSGVVQNTTLSNWGSMHVCSRGVAVNTVVGFHGYMCVFSGGTANSVTVSSGGNLHISSGARTSNIVLVNGGLNFPVALDTYVQGRSAGSGFIMQNGNLGGYTINSFFRIHVSSGGTATDTMVKHGYFFVSSGGSANNTTINTNDVNLKGYMFIENGGKATNITVNSGGYLKVSSGGTALNVTSMAGAEITVVDGGTITYA